MLPLLLVLLIAITTQAWLNMGIVRREHRKVVVDGILSCVGSDGKLITMDKTRVALMEEDRRFIKTDDHDLLHETVTKEGGVFHLGGEDTEYAHALFAPYIRFFLKVDVLCAHPDNSSSYFETFCEDKKIKKRCADAKSDAKGYKWATFTHQFEFNPNGDAKLKGQYSLNCTFGMKDEQWGTLDGLNCAGGLCSSRHCGYEISLEKK